MLFTKGDEDVLQSKNDHLIGVKTIFFMVGMLFILMGFLGFLLGAVLGLFRHIFVLEFMSRDFIALLIWYSALPVVLGIVIASLDLSILLRNKRRLKSVLNRPLATNICTVVLTAYNDEKSIGASVQDFLERPEVARVIVVSNNSSDRTLENARNAGAIALNEETQGYGPCVARALSEGAGYEDTEVVVLCEGDMTFRAADLDKFFAYIRHADIVLGTRIVEQLQEKDTQVTLFMHYGNLFVAKLLESKYMGDVSITDVGTTYKMIRREVIQPILARCTIPINLEFNPYFIEESLQFGAKLVECPITFFPRVGQSKGGNVSNSVAFRLGMRMMKGIIFGWSSLKKWP